MSIGKSSISRLSGGKQNPTEKTAKKFPEANEVTETAAKKFPEANEVTETAAKKAEKPAKSAAKKATGKRTKENAKTATAAFCAVGDALPYWLL